MKEYLLFIDTEASGLPRKWNVNFEKADNWPFIAQLSWIVYTWKGQELKRENHYIKSIDFQVSESAEKVHGITTEFLAERGEERKEVLSLLVSDLRQYQPLVVGHFTEFDYYLLGADGHRAGIENPLKNVATYCTMVATTHFVQNPAKKYLTLCQLNELLFHSPLNNHHNAIDDAHATAQCFFELLKRGEITEEAIERDQKFLEEPKGPSARSGCSLVLVALLVSLTVILML